MFQPECEIDLDELEAIFRKVNAEEFDGLYALESARQDEPELPVAEDDEIPW